MNPIDKALLPFAPGVVAKRLAARHAVQAYEAAKPSRRHRARSEARSGNGAVEASGKSLRQQARYLDENHDIVTGLLDRLEERIVGHGIAVEPLPLGPDGELDHDLAGQIKAAWSEWSTRPEVTGTLTRPALERLICRTWLRDGEALGKLVRGRVAKFAHWTPTLFSIEALEPDYLPLDFVDASRNIRQGIQCDEWGRRSGFWLHKRHPSDVLSIESDLKRVPADAVVHIANRKRLGQLRGVSILHPVLIRLADLKDYEESERVAARLAAALTMYIKRGEPSQYTPENAGTDPETGAREIPIAPGMVFDGLAPGEDVGLVESNRPSALLEGFRNAMLRAVATGTRVGYSTLSRDYNGTYSAQRQELVESQAGYQVLQDEFVDQWARPIYRAWLQMAITSGVVTLPAGYDMRAVSTAIYIGPVMPWIDPSKEAKAWKELVAAGFADEAEVARARGREPAELKKRRAAEIQENRERGLVFSSDHYHNTGGAQNATTKEQGAGENGE